MPTGTQTANYGVNITVNETQAVQGLNSVSQAATQTKSAFTELGTQGEQANQRLGQSVTDLTSRERQLQQAANDAGNAQGNAGNESSNFAGQAVQLGHRVAAASMAIQAMTQHLGGAGASRTAGLIGSMVMAGTQGAQLGMMLGPTGALVGGILGAAIPALTQLITSQEDAATAAQHHAEEIHHISDATHQAVIDLQHLADVQAGGAALLGTSEAELIQRSHAALEEQRQIAAQVDEINGQMSRIRGVGPEAEGARQRFQVQLDALNQQRQAQQTILDNIREEQDRRGAATRATEEQAQAEARRAAAAAETARSQEAERQAFQERAEHERKQHTASSGPSADDQLQTAMDEARQRAEAARQLAAEQARAVEEENTRKREAEARSHAPQAGISGITSRHEQEQRELDQLAQAQARNMETFGQAATTFRDAWSGSVEAVVGAFGRFNDAARQAGQVTLTTSQGMTRSMESVGHSALMNLGQGVAQGFAAAVSAAIHGAKSFGEAMLSMLGALLDSIMQQAIVQAIMEVAQAISAIARYDEAGAAMHFAAAAAWGAVAVVAGAGSAGISAATSHSGGGGAGAAPSAAASHGASPQPTPQQPANITLVYNGSVFATNDEMVRSFKTLQRQAAALY